MTTHSKSNILFFNNSLRSAANVSKPAAIPNVPNFVKAGHVTQIAMLIPRELGLDAMPSPSCYCRFGY